jgi:hypothetical protein
MTTRLGRVLASAAVLALGAAAAQAGHRNRNVSIRDGENPGRCEDVRVFFDDREAARAEERMTVPATPGTSLHIEAARNSGAHVRESDRADFEVVACKAAPTAAGLSGIALERSGDTVTVRGPSGDDWVGYLLVVAPRGASLEISATNGPIGLAGLSGRVVASTRNGPISVRDSSGDLDLHAQNGPIEFEGAGGKLRMRTENGPIEVELSGDAWTGDGLDARAVNGPVSLAIPAGYRSAAVVESRGHSPFRCRGEACAGARRTWDDDHRRIELGEGPALVRLSTENGPVSVRAGSGTHDDGDEEE